MAAYQKGAIDRHATVVFADESGFGLTPHVARTWAPRGTTPILRHSQRDRSVASAISAVTYRPWVRSTGRRQYGLYFQLHRHAIRSRDAIGFVRHLLCHIRGPIELVWDRLGAHTGNDHVVPRLSDRAERGGLLLEGPDFVALTSDRRSRLARPRSSATT